MNHSDSDILATLPHRPPFLFVTEVRALRRGDRGEAVWCVTGDEPFFAGHFPGAPIVPGVLIAEALAQFSGLVGPVGEAAREPRVCTGAHVTDTSGRLAHCEVRFDDAVRPPAEILLESRVERVLGALCQFEVRARVDDRVVARGRLTLGRAPAEPEVRA